MQTQLRHFDQLVETRQTLLKYRANLRQSWIALAMAYHLNGQLDPAKKVLEQYEATVRDIPPYDPEHSELLLYHVRILDELGHYVEALDFLTKSAKSRSITDRSMIAVLKGLQTIYVWSLCSDYIACSPTVAAAGESRGS